jgi:electron transport complex protein RnfB
MMTGLTDILLLAGLGLSSALLLVAARRWLEPEPDEVIESINDLLPQTQCAQCGYPGCRPYAEAVAEGEAINRCPPGGKETIERLAELLGREALAPDEACGEFGQPALAVIREAECIGCTLCLPACPVDAIIGAPQQMHTIIESLCTGCDLCREPCPVDCIDLIALPQPEIPPIPADRNTCINCGDCITACPRDLQPQELFWFRSDLERSDQLKLDDCIECGRCDRVCPSELPLTETFRVNRARLAIRREDSRRAEAAERRFTSHEVRIAGRDTRVAKRPSANDRESLLHQLRSGS